MKVNVRSFSFFFLIVGILISFTIGFLFNILFNIPKKDNILKIVDHELNLIQSDRDLTKNPHRMESNLLIDTFFHKSTYVNNPVLEEKILNEYSVILNEKKSKENEAIFIDFKYPKKDLLIKERQITYVFDNLDTVSSTNGLINLEKYNTIELPIKISLDQTNYKAHIILTLVVSKKPNIINESLPKIQFISKKELPVNSGKIENLVFSFNDFKIDLSKQPAMSRSRLNELKKVNLSNKNYKGYLFQLKKRILFSKINNSLNNDNQFVSGKLLFKDPIIYQNRKISVINFLNYLFGFVFSIIFFLIWLLYIQIKRINNQIIEIQTSKKLIDQKELEIKELEFSISRKVEIEKEIIKGLRGYYHWELNENEFSDFKGINKEDFFSNKFLNSFFFENYKKNINDKTIILIIDFDIENNTNHNYLFYYNPEGIRIKFPNINITRKSYWFYLLAFLIQTPQGYLKMDKLDYNNVLFNNLPGSQKPIPCLRIPQNNYDLGIDNEKYIEMVKRYGSEDIIKVERKQKERIITYSLNRNINYALFVHSKFIQHSSFIIKDNNIIHF